MPGPRIVDDLSAAGAGPFVLLAGAGISLWHPSSLPTWSEFNTALLDEAKARARRALPPRSPLHQDIESLNVNDIGSKAFSNALVEILAGESYFSVVSALAFTEPNEAHRAIARLVRRRVVAAIVTTNFDTLIERGIADEGLAADVYSQPRDYERPSGPRVPVFKIHGSATDRTGLIDTVGQKLRGLAPGVRERLCEWFAKHPVISLGYSGGDLEFAADYLTLRVIPVGTDRIWWVVRPEDRERLEPTTQALIDQRGAFVAMSQAAALEAIGAGSVALEWNVESRRERLALLRSQGNALFQKHGALNTLAFCMRLVSAAGR
ncbi:MAG: SIR2 family protein, partial [Gemmatimonadota bacterium]|nr:SIR2 family protein [Gemmatimonadota bacterium]